MFSKVKHTEYILKKKWFDDLDSYDHTMYVCINCLKNKNVELIYFGITSCHMLSIKFFFFVKYILRVFSYKAPTFLFSSYKHLKNTVDTKKLVNKMFCLCVTVCKMCVSGRRKSFKRGTQAGVGKKTREDQK